MEISVVIPVYRNENHLKELRDRLQVALNQFDYEVIFVNDCSPDNSIDLLNKFSSTYNNIQVLNLKQNIGQQRATLEGLKLAIGNRIVVLDGDLQDSPELILELYKLISPASKAAYVKRAGVYQSKSRMLTSILIKRVVQLLSGLHYKAGSYYMFKKEILPNVIKVGNGTKYPYMSIVVAHFGGKLKYFKASRGKSIGDSGYNFVRRIKAALMAVNCSIYCTYCKLFKRI